MPSVWDDRNNFRSAWDAEAGTFRRATPEQIRVQDAERDRKRRAARNSFIKAAVYGTAGTLAGGYGLAALTGGAGATPMAGMIPQGSAAAGQVPAGTLASGVLPNAAPAVLPSSTAIATGGSNMVIPSMVSSGGGGGGGGLLGGLFQAGDFGRYGVPALANAGMQWYGNRQANNAADRAAQQQQAQYEETQKFLKEQAELERQDFLAVEAEKKRQWEEEQAEKRRRYEAREPYRQAGIQNLTRMSNLMDVPTPERLDLSFLNRGRG